MNKPPTTKTVVGGRERRGRIPDASIPDWAAHKRRQVRPVGQRERAAVALQPTARKRGGARFGPPPKRDPHPGMQAPKPMGAVARTQAYTGGTGVGRLTARQERQINRMTLRNADRHAATDLIRDALSAKGRPTPKRGRR